MSGCIINGSESDRRTQITEILINNQQSTRQMNQRFFRLLAVCLPLLLAVVPVRGQDSAGDGSTKETGLSIDIREKPLSEVLTQLQQLSGCNFLYDADAVADVPKITLKMKAAALTDILDRIAEITRLEYTRVDNTFTFGSGGGNGQDIR